MLSAIGDAPLMPDPERECFVVSASSGFVTNNFSWMLSRLIRDFAHKKPEEVKVDVLRIFEQLRREAILAGLDPHDVRVSIQVSVFQSGPAASKVKGNWVS